MPLNHQGLIISTMFGFLSGLIINYFLSVLFVYQNTKKTVKTNDKKVFLIFSILSIIGLIITELGMIGANKIIEINFNSSNIKFVYEMIAKVIMTAIVLVYNYISRKLIIFK